MPDPPAPRRRPVPTGTARDGPDRAALLDRLGSPGRTRPAHVVVAMIWGLDGLREAHGPGATAHVVERFVGLLRTVVGEADLVATEGVGEITVVTATDRDGVEQLASRMSALVDAALSPEGQRVDLGLSLGVAAGVPGLAPDVSLEHAWRAAVAAHRRRSRSPVWFDDLAPEDRGPVAGTVDDIRLALRSNELELWYQPILDTRTDRIEGFEALLRWRRPDRGIAPAAEFMETLETTATMLDVGELVLRSGCAQLARWQAEYLDDAPILALNVAVRQLRHPDFAAVVRDEIERSGVRPDGLHLEVTRPDEVERDPDAVATLAAIRALGVAICVDGVDATSMLDPISRIRPDVLKIDREVVDRLPDDAGAVDIVRAAIGHAAANGMTAIATGVVSDAHRDHLLVLGCDRIQGFLVAPAVPVELADALLAADRSPTGAPAPEALVTVVHAHRHLRSIDASYRPSSLEIAALAGVRPGQVRAVLVPPRRSAVGDAAATDPPSTDQAISTMP